MSRLSDHQLAIETGKYVRPKVDPKDCICPVCIVTQDETHCLIKCEINTTNCTDLFHEIIKSKPSFKFMDPIEKFIYLSFVKCGQYHQLYILQMLKLQTEPPFDLRHETMIL